MSKFSLLIASCFLVGSQLHADSIQTLTITSLTASAFGSAPLVMFTASGPSVRISGQQGPASPPSGLLIGTPIGPISFALPPNGAPPLVFLGGTIGTTIVQLEPPSGLPTGGALVSGTPHQLVPASAETITFPGTVKGEYPAFACGTSELPPLPCTGPQIAN